jgi:hypothetical protein
MSALDRMLLEIELSGLKELLDFYVWRLEQERRDEQIDDAINTWLERIFEIQETLKQDES